MSKYFLPFGIISFILFIFFFFVSKPISIIFIFLLIFFAYFFRDPKREPECDHILAPADGKVIEISQTSVKVDDVEIKNAKKVSIFMSIFDVHINRAPLDGKVEKMIWKKGKFLVAHKNSASEENHRLYWIVNSKFGLVVFTQVAGAIARRIIPFKKEGDEIKKGEKIGIIMFGSRFDLYLPENFEITVKPYQKVFAGKTCISKINN